MSAADELWIRVRHPGPLPAPQMQRWLAPIIGFFGERPGPLRLRIEWHVVGMTPAPLEMAVGGYVTGDRDQLQGLIALPQIEHALTRHRRARLIQLTPPRLVPERFASSPARDAVLATMHEVQALRGTLRERIAASADPRAQGELERLRDGLTDLHARWYGGRGKPRGKQPTSNDKGRSPQVSPEEWIQQVDEVLSRLVKARPRTVRLTELARELKVADSANVSESIRAYGFAWMGKLPTLAPVVGFGDRELEPRRGSAKAAQRWDVDPRRLVAMAAPRRASRSGR